MSDQTWSDGRCDQRWTGLSAAHCTACHVTFAGVDIFDRHQVIGPPPRCAMTCKSPSQMRGVTEVRPGVFGKPRPRIAHTRGASKETV